MRLIGESGGELSAPATPETGNKAVEEEEEVNEFRPFFNKKYFNKYISISHLSSRSSPTEATRRVFNSVFT